MTTPDFKRVVVRVPNWLGDAVLALPALAGLREGFPHADITIAAGAAVGALFREVTSARPNHVLELPGSSRAVIASLQGGGFDLGVLLPNSFRSAWQFRRAGIPARWGYATAGRGWLLTARAAKPRGVVHQADYYRALVTGLGIAAPDSLPRLAPSASSRDRAQALLDQRGLVAGTPIVGLAPGAAYGAAKQWPVARVAALAAAIVRERGATCLVMGAAHDRPAAREIESWLRTHAPEVLPRVIDLVGQTSLATLVGVTARCDVFVSNDSGAMHVAAALGRPVVAIFGPTDERATRPLGDHDVITRPAFCRPCLLRDCPIDHRCMTRITIDTVLAATVARLDRVRLPRP